MEPDVPQSVVSADPGARFSAVKEDAPALQIAIAMRFPQRVNFAFPCMATVSVMTEADKVFVGLIPALYDRYLGPFPFEPYALDLAKRLEGFQGRLLETAAGTGIVTRALAHALPASVAITATDLNQPMLDHAAQRLDALKVTWRQANALTLPFEDTSFDAVVCQFGVMFFPDKPAGVVEALRVLSPGGRFLFSVWDRIEENEIPAVVSAAVVAVFPHDPPSFLARTPHGYHDKAHIHHETSPSWRPPRRDRNSSAPQPGCLTR